MYIDTHYNSIDNSFVLNTDIADKVIGAKKIK